MNIIKRKKKLGNKYPVLKCQQYNGYVYTFRKESSATLQADNGLLSNTSHLYIWSSLVYGCVCTSLLPEIAAVFAQRILAEEKDTRSFIYCLKLKVDVVMCGGTWLQVIIPGALPFSGIDIGYAREVICFNGETIELGDPVMLVNDQKETAIKDLSCDIETNISTCKKITVPKLDEK